MTKLMRLFLPSVVLISCLGLIGCAEDDNQEPKYIQPPQSQQPQFQQQTCLTNAVGQGCNYNYGQHSGFQSYPVNQNGYYQGYDQQYSGGFCHCQSGMPVYQEGMGLGCAQQLDPNLQYSGWNWTNDQRMNPTQFHYPQQMGGGCYQNIAQACDVNAFNGCGSNSYCHPTNYGGSLGVCVVVH
jgi:hypothetical protein